jgi:hypothetical protein
MKTSARGYAEMEMQTMSPSSVDSENSEMPSEVVMLVVHDPEDAAKAKRKTNMGTAIVQSLLIETSFTKTSSILTL